MQWTTPPPRRGRRRRTVRTSATDLRIRVRFAWLPIVTTYGVTVWLERYRSVERYIQSPVGGRWRRMYARPLGAPSLLEDYR